MVNQPDVDGAVRPRERTVVLFLASGLVILFGLLLHISWLKWGDAVIDTGRELEIPWKISTGDVLYRDMAYNYGPFSPYLNALFLNLFGTKLISLVISGILAAAAGAVLVYLACRICLGRPASLCMVGVFLFECAFQHYYYNGNFNFILPYSFPMVHATLAALWALILLARYLESRRRLPLAFAGLLTGVSFLCKVEMAGAILVPVAILPLMVRIKCREGALALVKDTAAWFVPLLLTLVVGFLPFIAAASFHKVIVQNVFKPQLVDFSSNIFFMQNLGLDALEENLSRIALSIFIWAILVAAIGFGSDILHGKKRTDRKASGFLSIAIIGGLTAGVVILAWFILPQDLEFRGLPVAGLLVLLVSSFSILFAKRKQGAVVEDAKLLAFSLFAVLALIRMFFGAGTSHYGFCLALPGVLLFAVLLLRLVPRWFPVLNRHPRVYAFAVLCLLVSLSARNFFVDSLRMYDYKTIELSGPGGRLRIIPALPGSAVREAVNHLNMKGSTEDTLLVLPEGALVNFLSHQRNPTYYNLFIPPELNAPGVEAAVISQIEEHRVDRVLIVDRDVREYGFRGFGVDYGRALMNHVHENYDVEASFGPPPYNGRTQGGCVIYRRKLLE